MADAKASAAAKKYERDVGDKSVPARHRVYGAEDMCGAFDFGARHGAAAERETILREIAAMEDVSRAVVAEGTDKPVLEYHAHVGLVLAVLRERILSRQPEAERAEGGG